MITRGIRNNNPFNIRRSNEHWLGEVDNNNDSQFKRFDSMEMGIRAGLKLLTNYYTKHGLLTITEILNRFAPPSENNTKAYIEFVYEYIELRCRTMSLKMYFCLLACAIMEFESKYTVSEIIVNNIAEKYNLFYLIPNEFFNISQLK